MVASEEEELEKPLVNTVILTEIVGKGNPSLEQMFLQRKKNKPQNQTETSI